MTILEAVHEAERRCNVPEHLRATAATAPRGAFETVVPGREEETVLAFIAMVRRRKDQGKSPTTSDVLKFHTDATTTDRN